MGHESELFDNLSSPGKIPVASSETFQSSHSSHWSDKSQAGNQEAATPKKKGDSWIRRQSKVMEIVAIDREGYSQPIKDQTGFCTP